MPPSSSPSPTTTSQAGESEPLQPVAGLLAILFPGLGHWYLGRPKQALAITCGIMLLYVSGLLIGGISCVDRKENFIWFLGQALNGPITFGIDALHQSQFKVIPSGNSDHRRWAFPNEYRDPTNGQPVKITLENNIPTAKLSDGRTVAPAYPPYIRSLSRMNEMGTLFITIAGFLNIIVIIDAMFNHKVEKNPHVDVGVKKTLQVPSQGAA